MNEQVVPYLFFFMMGIFTMGVIMVSFQHMDDKHIYNKGFEDGFKKGSKNVR